MFTARKDFLYMFNGNEYTTYSELAEAFASDFDAAVAEVLKKDFLTKFKKDKLISARLDVVVRRCKYSTNAAALVINVLDENQGIVLGDQKFSNLEEIETYVKNTYPAIDELVRLFFIDKCASFIFAPKDIKELTEEELNYWANIVSIENNFDLDFAYAYLAYSSKNNKDKINNNDLKNLLSDVLSVSERAIINIYELSKDDNFLCKLTDYVGFKAVCKYCRQTLNKDFYYSFIELIRSKTNYDLKKVLTNGYHVWLVENYKNYNYNSKSAKKVYKKLKKLSKENSFNEMTNDEAINNGKFALEIYYEFIELFTDNLLTNPSKVRNITAKDFAYFMNFEKNDTLVCKDYLVNCLSEEANYEQLAVEERKETIFREIAPSVITYKNQLVDMRTQVGELKAYKKKLRSQGRFIWFMLIISLGLVGLYLFRLFTNVKVLNEYLEYGFIGISSLSLIISFIFAIKNSIIQSRCKNKLRIYTETKEKFYNLKLVKNEFVDYDFSNNPKAFSLKKSRRPLDKQCANYKDSLLNELSEKKYKYFLETEVKNFRYLPFSFVQALINSIAVSVAVIYLFEVLPSMAIKLPFVLPSQITFILDVISFEVINWYYYIGIIPLFTLVFNLFIKKRRGLLTTLLVYILGLVVMGVVMYFVKEGF